jgi:Ion channel
MTAAPPLRARPAEFRYGVVFVLTLANVVWQIVGPAAGWSRALALALQIAALVVIVATSRARATVRRKRTLPGTAIGALAIAAVAAGLLPAWIELAGSGLLSVAIPAALVGGLLRLVRARGVTLQVVAGALGIYLLIGLAFASAVGLLARMDDVSYFVSGAPASQSNRVYYSFTVLTTTGFGDLTAATPAGHALSVVEMLTGQIYLVTVIGVLVGSFSARRG